MRLGGRTQAAIDVLDDIEKRKRPASEALRDWGLAHRFAGGGDRSAIGSLVYDSLRRRSSQAWRMGDDSPASIVYATLIGQWNLTIDELGAAFEGDRFSPAMPPAERLAAWQERDLDKAPDHVRADIAQWCQPHFERAFGGDWVREGAALARRPPLDMRANTLKASRDKVLARLQQWDARPGPLSPQVVRIEPGIRDARLPNVQAEPEYQKGWFEIQDAGSQAAARLAGARPGQQVLDFCAGAGGKTLALAAAMENRGQIHAHDSDRNRLAPIFERLKRAGVRNAQVHARVGDLEHLAGRMDLVLVDAPCTGSGTWRRRPDAKWRLDERNLAQRQGEHVRPGGQLVYVTCSLLPPENADRIEAFLARNRDFLAGRLDMARLCDPAHHSAADLSRVTLTPLQGGCDGFFVASFVRMAD